MRRRKRLPTRAENALARMMAVIGNAVLRQWESEAAARKTKRRAS
jgi:hypothetical protein